MPPTLKHCTPQLSIELRGAHSQSQLPVHQQLDWETFVPGSTVAGVVTSLHGTKGVQLTAQSRVTITIQLFGRAKTKIVHKTTSQQRSTRVSNVYRSRCNFFTNGLQQTNLVLHDGPLDLPSSAAAPAANDGTVLSWPFAIAIPTTTMLLPQPDMLESTFLPLTAHEIARHSLPDTFYDTRHTYGVTAEGFVEYHLVATLRILSPSSRGGTKYSDFSAVYPIAIKNRASPQPFTGDPRRLFTRQFPVRVQSYHLDPDFRSASDGLSFTQKSRQFFGSSKVPQLRYHLQATVPTRIELDSTTDPLSIYLVAVPDPDKTSTSLHGLQQTIRVDKVKLTIHTHTMLLAPGNYTRSRHDDHHHEDYNTGLDRLELKNLAEPITIPCCWGAMERKGRESGPSDLASALDFGKVLQLKLHETGLFANGERLIVIQPPLSPSFSTYNISHMHEFEWKLVINMAGEQTQLHFLVPTTLVPRRADDSPPPYVR